MGVAYFGPGGAYSQPGGAEILPGGVENDGGCGVEKIGRGGLGGVIPPSTASHNKKETQNLDRVPLFFYCQIVRT